MTRKFTRRSSCDRFWDADGGGDGEEDDEEIDEPGNGIPVDVGL